MQSKCPISFILILFTSTNQLIHRSLRPTAGSFPSVLDGTLADPCVPRIQDKVSFRTLYSDSDRSGRARLHLMVPACSGTLKMDR